MMETIMPSFIKEVYVTLTNTIDKNSKLLKI